MSRHRKLAGIFSGIKRLLKYADKPIGTTVLLHVWMAPGLQEFFCVKRSGRLQSCVRPFDAVHMTAGPDGFRESSPYQFAGI